ncbi:MAG: sugar phosphate isomerase/epimerase family protein [Saccharofermentanales bacterium]
MIDSMYKFMKVGLIHFMAYPATMKGEGPILETIRKIAVDDYFNAIEITWIKDPETRKQVKHLLETSHMTIAYGAQPRLLTTGLNINDLDDVKRSEAVSTLKCAIDEAYEMGASGMAFLSGRYEPETIEESYNALVKSTLELCGYAASRGTMRIVHEIFDFDIDKKSLIGPAKLAKRYAEEIKQHYSNFGLMVDLSHLPLIGETAPEAIYPIKEHIVHAHIGNCVVASKDFPAYGDVHPRFGFPGSENDVDEVAGFLKVLFDIGFLNPVNPPVVSFEVKPFGDEDSEVVIANAKRTLNEAWARL